MKGQPLHWLGLVALMVGMGYYAPVSAQVEEPGDESAETTPVPTEPPTTAPVVASPTAPTSTSPTPSNRVLSITPSQTSASGETLRISMNLQDAELRDVLKVFSQQSHLNIIAAKDVEDKRVTLFLQNVAVQDALDQILRANNLVSEKLPDSDIYLVKAVAAPSQSAAVETVTRIYKLKYARISKSVLGRAVSRLIKGLTPFEPLAGRLATTSGGGGGISGTSSFGGGSTGSAESEQVESGGIDLVIQKLLTEHGTLVGDERTNSLIVSDVASNFPRLEAAIAKLDVKTPQVLIEVELVETTLGKMKALGLEYGTGSEGTLATLTPATLNTRFPFTWTQAKGVPGASAGTIGSIATSQFLVVLKALEKDTDTRILARPKVLTMDNESAVIRLTENTAISITSSSQSTTGTVSTEVERSQTGIILSVTPQVNEDGDITMLVEPSVNKPVVSSLTSQSQTILNPKERSARALVRLHDGNTFVLGGLIDRKDEDTMRKVPILGDIPLLGLAFRKQNVDHSDTELLVFITPHIIRDDQMMTASAPTGAFMATREQEHADAREAVVEEALNTWEQRRRYHQ